MTFNTTNYSLYLPAVNDTYAEYLLRDVPKGRAFPSDLKVSDLAFWDRKNKLFYYPYVLHSIGQFTAGKQIDNALTRTGRTDKYLFGDSGGFQIGNGNLKGFKGLYAGMEAQDAIDVWDSAYDVKKWIVGWLDTYTNYAMTIDMPLWATRPKHTESPFHKCSYKQLTDMTVDNLKFIELHMKGQTKWLNVVQGLDEQSKQDWWDATNFFRKGGWAIGSGAGPRGGLAQMLHTFLMMKHDDAFTGGNDWLHTLGKSEMRWAIMLTTIQQCIQKENPKFRISYDTASPFQQGGRYEVPVITPTISKNIEDWRVREDESFLIQSHALVGSTERFPYNSPLGNQLQLGHLNVQDYVLGKRQFDTLSNMLLINHNVWVYLDAFQRANDAAFGPDANKLVPDLYLRCMDIIREAFERKDWRKYITQNQQILDEFHPTEYK
jgi:hypothetical protein